MEHTHFPPDPAFAENFTKKPFLFSHNLNSNDLFSIQSVEKLADTWSQDPSKSGFFILDKQLKPWGSDEHKTGMLDAFRHAEISRMRMKLSFIHTQPEYHDLLKVCTAELGQQTGVDIATEYQNPVATLFISSPNEFTDFHIDAEANFLLQLAGTKTVYVFDGNDRDILDWADIENYWFNNYAMNVPEEVKATRGVPYLLTPGVGIHIPVHFPHMVANGPTSSMSLSVAYLPPADENDVLHANYHLRKLGLKPSPPGEHKIVDKTKIAVVAGARSLKRTVKHLQGK